MNITGQWEKFVFGSDNHGDQADYKATAAFLNFCSQWKPTIRVHGGDNWDFRPLRRKADEYERRDSLAADFASGLEFLREFRPTHLLRGNHDERLWDLAENSDGVIGDYAQEAVEKAEKAVAKLHCRMMPYNKRYGVLRVGKLGMMHGCKTGIGAARYNAMTYGNVLFGHVHSIDHVTVESEDRRMGRAVGCLCKLDPDYARALPGALRWAHGWAYGVVHKKTGHFHVWQAESVTGRFVVASALIEL